MNLKQLQHFVTLAESGNVHRASARLNISQPALSKSIRTLEEELDVVLFDRLSRGVRLTPIGQWLLSRSCSLLSEVQQLHTEIDLIKRQANGSVRIAAGTVLCSSLIPVALARLREVAANVQVVVESGYWDHQKHMLLNGEIDFFVADSRELEDIIEFELVPLPAEPICVYVRSGHALLKKKKPALSDLQKYPFTGLTKIPKELERVLAAYPELPAGMLSSSAVASNDFGLLRTSAVLTDVLFFSPPSAVQEQIRRRELVRLNLPLPPQLQTHFAIVWLKSRRLSTTAELMKRTIMECALQSFQAGTSHIAKA
ncbi:LysR family transcriptional regulator [Noviherbaspirillum sp. UKPF54]|uniref:LysR family transcriptional regulator n=1 Tax=Noviherbaspirillum sp. UKPF54 TaxID=2601898 RepID=UPI0011B1938C|nr:LysR family transcriptional regulator [Noviherbaspirillum sp. UKPF54]QDZ27940.1 LysR family transcriptional regulator [Noviherbaspirillum sp. UKPF54]